MSMLVSLVALALVGLTVSRFLRRERTLLAEVVLLRDRVHDLATRVEAAEADVAHAVTQTEIAETLLVEKGVADEEDIEATRRRFTVGDEAPGGEQGGQDLH